MTGIMENCAETLAKELADIIRDMGNELFPDRPILAPQYFSMRHAIKNKIVAHLSPLDAARPSPSLDEETIEAAAKLAEEWVVGIFAGSRLEIQDRLERQNKVAREIADAIRALKSTPNQQAGRGEKLIALNRKLRGDCPRCGALIVGDVNAPAVSGEGWMKEAAKEIVEYVDNYDKWDWEAATIVRIIARHFLASEEGISARQAEPGFPQVEGDTPPRAAD